MSRRVEYFGHLAVIDAVEVVTEGSVGILVLKGFVLTFVALAVLLVSEQRSRWSESVVVKVPGRGSELLPRRRVIEQIRGVGSVGRSQLGSWPSFCCVSPLFMLSRGWRLWYSFIRCGACRLVMGSQVLSLSG